MASIAEIILFHSNFSEECNYCKKHILHHNIPVVSICLDSKESRDLVMSAQRVQIKAVPSLLVTYSNNELQLFVGRPKIMNWFESIIPRVQPSADRSDFDNMRHHSRFDDNDDTISQTRLSEKPRKKKKKGKMIRPKPNENNVEIIFDDDAQLPPKKGAIGSIGFPKPEQEPLNKNVMSLAQKMMTERNKALNIKDEK